MLRNLKVALTWVFASNLHGVLAARIPVSYAFVIRL